MIILSHGRRDTRLWTQSFFTLVAVVMVSSRGCSRYLPTMGRHNGTVETVGMSVSGIESGWEV